MKIKQIEIPQRQNRIDNKEEFEDTKVTIRIRISNKNRQLILSSITFSRHDIVEQELLTLPEHLSSPPIFSEVRVTRSLVLYVCFVDRCLSFCTFSFGHGVVSAPFEYITLLPIQPVFVFNL
jgi:hypothetical protein